MEVFKTLIQTLSIIAFAVLVDTAGCADFRFLGSLCSGIRIILHKHGTRNITQSVSVAIQIASIGFKCMAVLLYESLRVILSVWLLY